MRQVDQEVAAWKDRAELLICDAVNSREEVDLRVLRDHLERVTAVRP